MSIHESYEKTQVFRPFTVFIKSIDILRYTVLIDLSMSLNFEVLLLLDPTQVFMIKTVDMLVVFKI